jgi:uncharacterized protein (TIGR03083 family)
MTGIVKEHQWNSTRHALRDVTRRYAELIADLDPATRATADWTVADTTAHLVTIAWMDNALVGGGLADVPVPELPAWIARTTVDTVDRLNIHVLGHFTERDLPTLTHRLEGEVATLLDVSRLLDPDSASDWLGGSRVPVAGLLAHLVNETLVHGWDIARAVGRRWDMPPDEAARFFDVFLAGVTRHGYGSLQDRDEPKPGRRIAVELRSPHADPVVLVLAGDDVSLGTPGRDVDVVVHYDPGTLALMLFGRIGRVRAARSGVRVGGRRPWLLFPFLRAVRFPS